MNRPPETTTANGEPLAVIRKKVLLRLLCRGEAERLRIAVSETEIRAEGDRFRRHFALEDAGDFADWLAANGLDTNGFALAMRDIVLVEQVEREVSDEVETLLANQIAIGSARGRLAGTG